MINKKKRIFLCVILIIFLIILSGCEDKEFKAFQDEFDNTYFEIADTMDISDTFGSIDIVQTDENKEKINKLRVLLDDIKDIVAEDDENLQYDYNLREKRYQGLVIIRDSYGKWENLSTDEKRRVSFEFFTVEDAKRER